jgi:rsbT co-antagonist protein RsbR
MIIDKAILNENRKIEIELENVAINWYLDNGVLSFFGIDSALFWTDPSLVHMLAPLAAEIGTDLFRLLVAHSSSLGTKEDYHNMVSTLGNNFEDGFLAWGRAVSAAGWGRFEMPEYNPGDNLATVIVHNSWEIRAQRNLPTDGRWGAPFIQGKIIGIFGHAFGQRCWANDVCNYESDDPYVELKVYPAEKTIQDELEKLRYERTVAREQELENKVNERTVELKQALTTFGVQGPGNSRVL